MSEQNIDLLYTDSITFDGNVVKKLNLNNKTIWEAPVERLFTAECNPTKATLTTSYTDYTFTLTLPATPLRSDNICYITVNVVSTVSATGTLEVHWGGVLGKAEVIVESIEANSLDTYTVKIRARKTVSSIIPAYLDITSICLKYPLVY